MRAALDALSRHIPMEKATWTAPNGGFLIWLTLAPTDVTEKELHARLLSRGVEARLGSDFFTRPQKRHHLRLSISSLTEEEITEGIRRLGEALDGRGFAGLAPMSTLKVQQPCAQRAATEGD